MISSQWRVISEQLPGVNGFQVSGVGFRCRRSVFSSAELGLECWNIGMMGFSEGQDSISAPYILPFYNRLRRLNVVATEGGFSAFSLPGFL